MVHRCEGSTRRLNSDALGGLYLGFRSVEACLFRKCLSRKQDWRPKFHTSGHAVPRPAFRCYPAVNLAAS